MWLIQTQIVCRWLKTKKNSIVVKQNSKFCIKKFYKFLPRLAWRTYKFREKPPSPRENIEYLVTWNPPPPLPLAGLVGLNWEAIQSSNQKAFLNKNLGKPSERIQNVLYREDCVKRFYLIHTRTRLREDGMPITTSGGFTTHRSRRTNYSSSPRFM